MPSAKPQIHHEFSAFYVAEVPASFSAFCAPSVAQNAENDTGSFWLRTRFFLSGQIVLMLRNWDAIRPSSWRTVASILGRSLERRWNATCHKLENIKLEGQSLTIWKRNRALWVSLLDEFVQVASLLLLSNTTLTNNITWHGLTLYWYPEWPDIQPGTAGVVFCGYFNKQWW